MNHHLAENGRVLFITLSVFFVIGMIRIVDSAYRVGSFDWSSLMSFVAFMCFARIIIIGMYFWIVISWLVFVNILLRKWPNFNRGVLTALTLALGLIALHIFFGERNNDNYWWLFSEVTLTMLTFSYVTIKYLVPKYRVMER